jgi:tetratricopeptide (TPR) repeat protein
MAPIKSVSPVAAKRAARTLAGAVPAHQDPQRAQAIASYEAALQLMQQGKFDKAHAAFDKMLLNSPGELADRVRMYINACLLQISKGKTTFTSHEEQYDYAISLLNNGHYEDARQQFKSILAAHPTADFAFYGAPDRSHPPQAPQPHPGARRLRLPGHGRRSALHRPALSRGLTSIGSVCSSRKP